MRNRRLSFFVFLIAACLGILSAGCSKSGGNARNGSFTATVGGTPFAGSANGTYGFYLVAGKYWDITSSEVKSTDSTVFELLIFSPFVLNQPVPTTNSGISYYDAATGRVYYNTVGVGTSKITVTSLDSAGHKIGGTFSGILFDHGGSGDSLIVTNGAFNMSYVVE